MIRLLLSCALFVASPAVAQELQLPVGAWQLTERVNPLASYDLPVGPYADQSIPVRTLEGRVEKRAWRIGGGAGTTLQLLAPLRTQLQEAGYEILLDCAARACGGFDFRFGTDVIPAPDMYVAVRDYRFLSAVKGDQALSLLVSRKAPDAYIQIIQVSPGTLDYAPVVAAPETVVDPGSLAEGQSNAAVGDALLRTGRVILTGLEFETGANALRDGNGPILEGLAELLKTDPSLRIALVGHTDNVGGLAANIKLGRARAEAVRELLIEKYGLAPERIESEGVGYLAPLRSNDTPEGREANRRVEAVLLSR